MSDEIARSANYDIGQALDSAMLSNAAYLSGAALESRLQLLGWTPRVSTHPGSVQVDAGGGYEVGNAFAFAATREFGGRRQYVVSFRGTSDTADWIDNLGPFGFSSHYRDLRPLVEEALAQAVATSSAGTPIDVLITGHSLGGATATAALFDLFCPTARTSGITTDPTRHRSTPAIDSRVRPACPAPSRTVRRSPRGMRRSRCAQ